MTTKKKPAPKKTTSPKKKAKTSAVKAPEKRKAGRPVGSKYVAEGIAIRKAYPWARKNAVEATPGVRRVVIEVSNQENAIKLEKLVTMLEKKNRRLMPLLK